jgi:hypothetical protein
MEKKSREEIIGSIRMVLTKDQLMTFVSGLHKEQLDMIDLAVEQKEKEGFPEASAVIDHIMGLK